MKRESRIDLGPSAEQIVLALARGTCPSYVVKNRLRGEFPSLTTAHVLRRLKALESSGRVIRSPVQHYAVMIEWRVRPEGGNHG